MYEFSPCFCIGSVDFRINILPFYFSVVVACAESGMGRDAHMMSQPKFLTLAEDEAGGHCF